jgi:hypothetical protein
MHAEQTRLLLDQCRTILVDAHVSDEMRALADDLVVRLQGMHDARRLNVPVFALALDSLELVPELGDCVAQMRARLPTPRDTGAGELAIHGPASETGRC